MSWLYLFIDSIGDIVRYHYGRENNEPDGIIVYSKTANNITSFKPCAADTHSDFCERKAKEHFCKVIAKDFPTRLKVITG